MDIFKPGDFTQTSFFISVASKSPAAALRHPATHTVASPLACLKMLREQEP